MPYVKRSKENDVDNSGLLFTFARKMMGCETDVQFAEKLECSDSTISKIRHGVLPVSPKILIGVLENTDLSIREIRMLIRRELPDRLRKPLKGEVNDQPVQQ